MVIYQSIRKVVVKNNDVFRQIAPNKYQNEMYDNTTCSFQLLRDLAVKYQEFPFGGEWHIENGNNIHNWVSKICDFHIRDNVYQEKDDVLQYLKSKHISRIMLLGDSNGSKYNIAMIKFITDILSASCVQIKREDPRTMRPDPLYFVKNSSVPRKNIVIHERDCFSCKSTLTECHVDSLSFNITVEYIAMEYVLDNEVTTFRSRTLCQNLKRKPCDYSITYQEFLFKEYLSANYPDLLLILMNSHDKARKSPPKMGKDTVYFADILDMYLPLNTMTIWFSAISEYNKNKPLEYQNESEDLITQVNKALFDGILSRLRESEKNQFCFFDLERMSRPVLPWWNQDGVHMKADWYNRITHYLFRMLYLSTK